MICAIFAKNLWEKLLNMENYNSQEKLFQSKSADKIIIFSPVYNGGFLAHLKKTLDWLSLAYDENKYNSLFKDKTVGVITSVRGGGGNAQNAFNILSAQLMNYGLRVFEEFHLITNKEHQKDTSIEENQKVFENITHYVNRFLEF